MASSWQNLTRYTLCAYDRHWWGYEKLWTMPPKSSHNWVGTAVNDRADATGPC
jgi:hypothetical protein